MILPCGVSKAEKDARSGVTLAISVVSSPLRNLRASSPATLTTPRSGKSAAFMQESLAVTRNVRRGSGRLKGSRLKDRWRLLTRNLHREFAVADAGRQSFGVFGGRILAIGCDELAQCAEQRGLRQAIAV